MDESSPGSRASRDKLAASGVSRRRRQVTNNLELLINLAARKASADTMPTILSGSIWRQTFLRPKLRPTNGQRELLEICARHIR
jgi:hypothetical protein